MAGLSEDEIRTNEGGEFSSQASMPGDADTDDQDTDTDDQDTDTDESDADTDMDDPS